MALCLRRGGVHCDSESAPSLPRGAPLASQDGCSKTVSFRLQHYLCSADKLPVFDAGAASLDIEIIFPYFRSRVIIRRIDTPPLQPRLGVPGSDSDRKKAHKNFKFCTTLSAAADIWPQINAVCEQLGCVIKRTSDTAAAAMFDCFLSGETSAFFSVFRLRECFNLGTTR